MAQLLCLHREGDISPSSLRHEYSLFLVQWPSKLTEAHRKAPDLLFVCLPCLQSIEVLISDIRPSLFYLNMYDVFCYLFYLCPFSLSKVINRL